MDDVFGCMLVRKFMLDDFIEVLAATDNPNDYSNQVDAARCVGISLNDLTTDEIEYIERKLSNGNY